MHGGEWILMLLIFGPAVLGVSALAGAVVLFATANRDGGRRRTVNHIAGAVLLVIALGVGACYGLMFWR